MDVEPGAAYLKSHQIPQIFERLVAQLVKSKPSDPLEFLGDLLEKMQQQEDAAAQAAARPEMDFSTAAAIEHLQSEFTRLSVDKVLHREQFLQVLNECLEEKDHHEHLLQLNTIFDVFDRDRSGTVDISEFTSGLRILFRGTDEQKLEFAFSGLNYDHDGGVTVSEFLAYFKHYFMAKSAIDGHKLEAMRWRSISDHLRRVFKGSDTDANGSIDIAEFAAAVKRDPDHPFTLIWQSFGGVAPGR
eukprot:TRINITY_DN8057_c0_g1_i1.p1 TRINITY_DN8057_c0_g1~~TRINITY_DN8057_c0_g1_i1.p1  ORF type:complete len:244 (+),score=45.78 TRINITY_DN8057_c0_g1_i1:45-776(+)